VFDLGVQLPAQSKKVTNLLLMFDMTRHIGRWAIPPRDCHLVSGW